MPKHEVEVTVDETGEITLEAHGVKGKGCLKILDDLARAFGTKKGNATPTKEMYEAEPVKTGMKR